MKSLEEWWQANLPTVKALAADPENQNESAGNVYQMRRSLMQSIESLMTGQSLLTPSQVRGAFANYVDVLKADFKSIAASGWGPELIPEDDILQSQFPEVLEEQEQAEARLAELQALFAAANEEDFEDPDDTGVLPADEVKNQKDALKEANADWKEQLKTVKSLTSALFTEIKAEGLLPKGEKKGFYCNAGFTQKEPCFANARRILELADRVGHSSELIAPIEDAMKQGQFSLERARAIEGRLKRHGTLAEEEKNLKAAIKGIENKRDELVAQARQKISTGEAQTLILERLRQTLMRTYQAYLHNDQRACIRAIENLWDKYAVTARQIEEKRDAAAEELKRFLVELGYE
jgi:type I restriction enzyme M protein